MKVFINIVTYNSRRYIEGCLRSILKQSLRPLQILVIDNASVDGTMELIQEKFPKISILRNSRNLGFCQAHNQGIALYGSKLSAAEQQNSYIFIVNPDTILSSDYCRRLMELMEERPKVASASGKILRLLMEDEELPQPTKSDIIDSAGMQMLRNRQIADRGANEQDCGQFDKLEEVFAVSAVAACFRLSALEAVKLRNCEYFDEDFFAYKEDIDLAWRLRNCGWQAWYLATAVAFHCRATRPSAEKKIGAIRKQRQLQPLLIRQLSYKNHLLTIVKNDAALNFLIDFPWIFWQELKKFFYLLFFETGVLLALFSFLRQLPAALLKRRLMRKKCNIPRQSIRRWIVS